MSKSAQIIAAENKLEAAKHKERQLYFQLAGESVEAEERRRNLGFFGLRELDRQHFAAGQEVEDLKKQIVKIKSAESAFDSRVAQSLGQAARAGASAEELQILRPKIREELLREASRKEIGGDGVASLVSDRMARSAERSDQHKNPLLAGMSWSK